MVYACSCNYYHVLKNERPGFEAAFKMHIIIILNVILSVCMLYILCAWLYFGAFYELTSHAFYIYMQCT